MTKCLPRLQLVVAVGRNRVIGRRGELPWHLPEDLRHFKALTQGHAVIMGRRTWESIGRALPGRRSIVLSRQAGYRAEGAEVASAMNEALALARRIDPEPMVIGGAEVFEQTLPLATRIYLTEVDLEPRGDALFPELDPKQWRETARVPGNTKGLVFKTLERDPSKAV